MAACRRLTPANGIRPLTTPPSSGFLPARECASLKHFHLSINDFDADRGMITIVEGKFHKSRILPLHPSCVTALTAYRYLWESRHPATMALYVTEWGTSLKYLKVLMTFREIASTLGWSRDTRIHGLRHTFAVRRLVRHLDGEDVHRRIGELSTYLGHCKLQILIGILAIPELMALAAGRIPDVCGGAP